MKFVRMIFCNRPYRLLALFCLSVLIYFPLSLCCPVVLAVIGPMLWGIPHLVSGLRFANPDPSKINSRLISILFVVWVAVSCLRLASSQQFFHFKYLTIYDAELAAMLLVAVLFFLYNKGRGESLVLSLVLFFGLGLLSWSFPVGTSAFLLLAHNYVGYVFWIQSSATKQDKCVALVGAIICLGLSLMIVCGFCDSYFDWIRVESFRPFSDFDVVQLGAKLAPWSLRNDIWYRFFSVFVFGQSLHYFVWLKAIPEQFLKHQTPIGFRATFQKMMEYYSIGIFRFLILICVFGFAVWVFIGNTQARILYLSIAAFHGFYEFAGLSYLFFRPKLFESKKV